MSWPISCHVNVDVCHDEVNWLMVMCMCDLLTMSMLGVGTLESSRQQSESSTHRRTPSTSQQRPSISQHEQSSSESLIRTSSQGEVTDKS